MGVFEYAAVAKSGKNVKGIIDADTPSSARRKLREQGLFPTNVAESAGGQTAEADGSGGGGGAFGGRISVRDISLTTRQLAVLLQAGMPLVAALTALLDQTPNAKLRKILFSIRDKVNEGSSMADGLAEHPQVFKGLYVNMVRAGEASGALEQVLFRLADLQERQVRLQKRVMSAMMYPCVLALFGLAVIIILMLAIMPRLTSIFEQQGAELPPITVMVMGVSDFLMWYWWAILLAIACLVILLRAWIARPEGRKKWDRMKLRIPLYGSLQTKLVCAHFARTLGTMLESGLTMMVGLDVVKSVVQNSVVEEAIDEVKASVRRGQDLAQPLKDANLFPPMLVHMTDLGQRSGQLETMLLKVSDTYEEDVELTVDALVSIIEPVIIIIMAVFVGILVISILLPILQMTQNVRG